MKAYWWVLILAAVLGGSALAQADERAAVKRAVLDYVEGVYNVDPDRIERSVHTELAKRGFYSEDE